MNKPLIFKLLFATAVLTSCHNSSNLQNGDLLFVGNPIDHNATDDGSMNSAITAATGRNGEVNYTHVAIVEVETNGKVWIIDATPGRGVDRHPLDTFLSDFRMQDGSYPIIDIMRLKDNLFRNDFIIRAKQFCGRDYDLYFLPDNEEKYCSELVRDAYVSPNGEPIFHTQPMNFKNDDGTFPKYWIGLFEQLQQPIPQDIPGTNPNDLSKEQCLEYVGNLKP